MSKRLVLSVCAVALLSTSALATPGVAIRTANLRSEPNTTSEVLANIPAGGRLDVGDCKDGWCAVIFEGKSGFAIRRGLNVESVAPGYRPYPVAPAPYLHGQGDFYGPGGPSWGPYWRPGYGSDWKRL